MASYSGMTGEAEIRVIYPSKSPLKVRLMKDLSKNETSEVKLTFLWFLYFRGKEIKTQKTLNPVNDYSSFTGQYAIKNAFSQAGVELQFFQIVLALIDETVIFANKNLKMKKPVSISIILAAILLSCTQVNIKKRDISIIPKPVKLEKGEGHFILTSRTTLVHPDNKEIESVVDYFEEIIKIPTGYNLEECDDCSGDKKNAVIFKISGDDKYGDEGYSLEVTERNVTITAAKPAGLFYGIQTILQLLPVEIYSSKKVENLTWDIPAVKIFDKPAFKWRGMHLDVSRHFFPKEFIKHYIDLIAMHKMNIFHWHLTDDNGWRIEIKKYPQLTDICAWRVPRDKWRGVEPPKPGEKATYGGYYTQDDIREIVKYAAERQVEIIPEIEMPGHTSEVFAAFPNLSCTGKKTDVRPGSYWPNTDIFCAGNDSVFVFIENVLDEVAELFPSKYIHIGGDEADKTNWKKCKKCQKRIKDENLKDENELQSWFVKKIENYLISKGKRLIGWDEILEGGLAPEATVMSWRGFNGGIESAEMGHEVIMCPTSYCYFDYYQADPDFEPLAIGGFLPLKKVYSFNPVPQELSSDKTHYILGGQGNVWTEFISTPEHAEYMSVPRMTALAEVLWTPLNERNWDDLRKRLQTQFKRFDLMGVNYSKGSYRINIVPSKQSDGSFSVVLKSEQIAPVHYTLDGSDPTPESPVYKAPININKTTTVKAAIFIDGKLMEKISEKTITLHKAVGKDISLTEPNRRYKANGPATLVDGLKGSDNFRDGYWLGFEGKDMEALIDLGDDTPVNSVSETYFQRGASWVFLPVKVTFELLDKNKKVIETKTVLPKANPKEEGVIREDFKAGFDGANARFVTVHAYSMKKCPSWHEGAGKKSWIFTDEIVVE